MDNIISDYIKEIDRIFQTNVTTEHSFRPALHKLLEQMCSCTAVNEQKHIDCGAPDLTLIRKKIPFAFVECKDLEDGDLDGRRKNKEQFDRYKASLDTIIFTDYLDFHLYEHGEWTMSVRLAEIQGKRIRISDEARFLTLMEHVREAAPQRITKAKRLAELMAGKARLLRDVIEQALTQDIEANRTTDESDLLGYMEAFRQVLIHDINPKIFADIYAQTIAYGMFAARLHDKTPETFSREEAANLIPKSNPFLRKIFQTIAGYDLDERIAWIVDDLVVAFAATDMPKVMSGFGKDTQMTDPLMNFYEDFLFQYDPTTKKQCGVYYTPEPVVNFIVRAVDDILRKDFGLSKGLADTSKVEIEREIQQDNKHRKEKVMTHRVQVLDPATGTGTFLAAVVRQIKQTMSNQLGAWDSYVSEHLLPRLHGFELMMAPYTITHLKLDLEINGTENENLHIGVRPFCVNSRLKVFLTNSLEEFNPDAGTLFGNELSREANAASAIKKDAPIMVMIGNPPYSGESQNKSPWIMSLMEDYKKEPGGVMPLQERNSKWINNDYCKFIRLGQHYVDRNKEGILAYISANSFLDDPTFRGMRWHLLKSFDKIYVINLHGSYKKNETTPDGEKDENVFDIMVGTSINIFVKTGKKQKEELAKVFYKDLYGLRKIKNKYLDEHSLEGIDFVKVDYNAPYYFFVNKDNTGLEQYNTGFKIDDLLKNGSAGVVTARDAFTIANSKNEIKDRISHFLSLSDEQARETFNLGKDVRDWSVAMARADLKKEDGQFIHINYRPFDSRATYYTGNSKGFHCMPRGEVMKHYLSGNNLGICTCKQFKVGNTYQHVLVTDGIIESGFVSNKTAEITYSFPLYLYPEEGSMDTERRPNLDTTIWGAINEKVGRETTPEEIFDYIYGVLHSPAYRETYKEFLKVDFPRIPYPDSAKTFEHYIYYGHQLRELHLMHSIPNMPDLATLPVPGDWLVESLRWEQGRVYVNSNQYFENVPRTAWDFYIGGYQPAQKWLKDRKGRKLSYDELIHYGNIIKILIETDRLIREIDSQTGRKMAIKKPVPANADVHYHIDNANFYGATHIDNFYENN